LNILVIPISSPLLLGVYDENNKLVETVTKEGKTSDILPVMFEEILAKYEINALYYTKGPGSYMAIKVAYMFLKTLSISKKIELYGALGFEFNGNSPIKALGKKYFFNGKDGNISIDFLKENEQTKQFELPEILDKKIFDNDDLPTYNLPAVN
jgi:hypothetical protein